MKTNIIQTVFAIVFLFAINANSQTIQINPITENNFCAGTDLLVSFIADTGFASNNVFTVQISDANGSFDSFQNIGGLKSTSSGTITVSLPTNLTESSLYRFRVISSNPYEISNDNGTDITIHDIPQTAPYIYSSKFHYKLGDSVSIISNLGKIYNNDVVWHFGNDAVPLTYTGYDPPSKIIYTTVGKKTPWIELKSYINCSYSAIDTSISPISILGCDVEIDSNFTIVCDSANHLLNLPTNYNVTKTSYNQVWVLPRGNFTADIGIDGTTYIVETGGTLNISTSSSGRTAYLKPGASLNITGNIQYFAIIKSPDASVNYSGNFTSDTTNMLINCDSLTYVYTNAPKGGLSIMAKLGYSDVKENETINNIGISPNPASDILNINGNINNYPIKIYNIEGIKQIETENTKEIDISKLPQGVYYIQIGNYFTKFVKI